jgi:hypothetical protein
MAEAEVDNPDKSLVARFVPRRKRWQVTLAVMVLFLVALGVVWTQREKIAADVVYEQLEALGLDATYDVVEVGPNRQVLANVVIGDPARPDLTIEQVTVFLRYRLGVPAIGRVEVVRPRLYGSYREGRLSFGSLDQVLFAPSEEPPGLPDLDLKLVDGRALLETDYGRVGVKAEGEGELDNGFNGIVAAIAPRLADGGCEATGTSLYGTVRTAGGEPSFDGPVRLARLRCAGAGVSLADVAVRLLATGSSDFDELDARARIATGAIAAAGSRTSGLSGSLRASLSADAVDATYSLAARGVAVPQARLALLTAEGALRARGGFERAELDAEVRGNGLRVGDGLDRALAGAQRSGEGTLVAPLLRQMRTALAREERGSSIAADLTLRRTGKVTSLVVPSASLRGGSGASLLALSRFQFSTAGGGLPRLSGNIATGGAGMPRIAGRMERQGAGETVFRLRMQEYAAGGSALAVPQLYVAQARDGSLGFSGEVLASGPLPGGSARGLRLPVSGQWASNGTFTLWRRCTEIAFDRLAFASLELDSRLLTLCPQPGGAIVRSDVRGVSIAAGAPSLDVAGRLAGTPVRIASGPIGFAWPGALSARNLDISLGPADTASRFLVSNLDARLGGAEIAGTFADADVRLAAVPLDLVEAGGRWRYAGGVLALSEGAFTLQDRADPDRFEPLAAEGATLTLEDNVIRALATVRHPASGREVTDVAIVHNLSSAIGHADLVVRGLRFDEALQPDDLTVRALGVIANARGTVTGTGRIDWNAAAVTSTGEFTTQRLDFAAAFGPVRGARGTIRFDDLIGLTTAPGQRLQVDSINPGIEVLGGEVEFALRGGTMLSVAGGSWPFMGGRLILQSVDLNFGVEEERRYVFRIEGLEAAQFVQQMELGNLSARGTFDGLIPIVFDAQGNGRIEGGALDSRPPGGNVSYVGELTYEDLTPIANYAFAALRSLDYQTMTVRMDGPLTGEIVTRVRFDGVSQGEGTSSNFITRQIADLPIRFNVNIRAPFYQLITSIKAMYDPAFIRDPREVGLLDADGRPIRREAAPPLEAIKPEDLIPDEPAIQTQESESMP